MLLNSIHLCNFRQFEDTKLSFSENKKDGKNVTIVMGQIGTGKTTLAEAFRWCFYGKTSFADSKLLNNLKALEMAANSEIYVSVTIELTHRETKYEIKREQKYKKNSNGDVSSTGLSDFVITYKKDGNVELVRYPEETMTEILPMVISKYFIFDGERMGNISKQIANGKGDEFADAVKNLLGLTAFTEAMDHLNGKKKQNTVVKYFENQYDASSNNNISELRNEISDLNTKLLLLESKVKNADKQIDEAEIQLEKLSAQLRENKGSKELQDSRDILEKQNEKLEDSNKSLMKELLKSFNNNYRNWYLNALIPQVIEELEKNNSYDKGIPDITAKTIKYLIERKVCICGHPIEFGSDEYNELNKLLDYIPPKAIGTLLSEFKNQCMSISNDLSSKGMKESIETFYKGIRANNADYLENKDSIDRIDQQIVNIPDVSYIENEYNKYFSIKEQAKNDQKNDLTNIGQIKNDIARKEKRLTELALQDKKNQTAVLNKTYASYIYQIIEANYKKEESATRKELEEAVNEIFQYIYDGGFSLSLDTNYRIKINSTEISDFDETIELSSGQSMSVLFAFITGVIKIATRNQNKKDSLKNESNLNEVEESISEPYPLVMDAPLSDFDTTSIKNICNCIPDIAEQVIIFIKDTDGNLAKEYLKDKVDKSYVIEKENEFSAKLREE